jgi:hypothetical protein
MLLNSHVFFLVYSNIVTYHAEDGSGVGSAIIAGLAIFFFSLSTLRSAHFINSYDKDKTGCRVVYTVLANYFEKKTRRERGAVDYQLPRLNVKGRIHVVLLVSFSNRPANPPYGYSLATGTVNTSISHTEISLSFLFLFFNSITSKARPVRYSGPPGTG